MSSEFLSLQTVEKLLQHFLEINQNNTENSNENHINQSEILFKLLLFLIILLKNDVDYDFEQQELNPIQQSLLKSLQKPSENDHFQHSYNLLSDLITLDFDLFRKNEQNEKKSFHDSFENYLKTSINQLKSENSEQK